MKIIKLNRLIIIPEKVFTKFELCFDLFYKKE